MRGYMLTDDPRMLAPYSAETVPIQKHFAGLRVNAGRQRRAGATAVCSSDRYQIWLERSQAHDCQRSRADPCPQINQQNKAMMDEIRVIVDNMLRG